MVVDEIHRTEFHVVNAFSSGDGQISDYPVDDLDLQVLCDV